MKMPVDENGDPRFWPIIADPITADNPYGTPGHPLGLPPGWVGIVDEVEGGIIMWCHADKFESTWQGVVLTENN